MVVLVVGGGGGGGGGGVTGFLGSLKINLCEERRLEDTQNLKCEDRRLQKLPRFED